MGNKYWRSDRPTDAQRRKLFAMGKDGNRPMSKGEACDMIDGGGGGRSYSSSGGGSGGSGCLVLIAPVTVATLTGLGYLACKYLLA